MLVLTRKVDEQIEIGPDVIVTIIRVGRDNVRIGIEAPEGTRILRGEVVERVQGSEVRVQEKTEDRRQQSACASLNPEP